MDLCEAGFGAGVSRAAWECGFGLAPSSTHTRRRPSSAIPQPPDSSRSSGPHLTSTHVGPWPAPAPATFQTPLKPAPRRRAARAQGRAADGGAPLCSSCPCPGAWPDSSAPCPMGSASFERRRSSLLPGLIQHFYISENRPRAVTCPIARTGGPSGPRREEGGGPRPVLARAPHPEWHPQCFLCVAVLFPSLKDHVVPEILVLSMKCFFKDEHFLLKKILARSSRSPLYAFQISGGFSTLRVLFFLVKERTLPAAVPTGFLFPANSLPLRVSL